MGQDPAVVIPLDRNVQGLGGMRSWLFLISRLLQAQIHCCNAYEQHRCHTV